MSNFFKGSLFVFSLLFSVNAIADWDFKILRYESIKGNFPSAVSDSVSPTKKMKAPYSNLEASIGVLCNSDVELLMMVFSQPPKLNNTNTKNNDDKITARIKWGDTFENVILAQSSHILIFDNSKKVIRKLIKSKSALLELDWSGQGLIYFKFPLSGSVAALKKMRTFCSKLRDLKD